MTEHDSKDPWEEAGRRWASIGDKLRRHYREVAGDGGPSEDEVKSALETLGDAARAVADSVGSAMKDPEVRDQVKDATASFVTAIGQTFSQLGDELRRASGAPEPAEPAESAESAEPADDGTSDGP